MKKKSFLKVIIFLFVVFFCHQVSAFDEKEVRAFLNTTGEKLIETLGLEDKDARYAILDEMFEEKVDVEYMGKYVLGQYYKQFNDEQKETYFPLFKRYIKSLYKSYPIDFKTDEIGFELFDVVQKNKHIDAVAAIDLPEKYRTEKMQRVKVEFRLHEKDGKYLLADLKIADVSMLVVLRTRFMQMIKDDEEEIGWFLEDFEDLTISNERNLEPENENYD